MSAETLSMLFEHTCCRFQERIALKLGDAQLTYKQLAKRVDSWSMELTALGLGPQERVLIAASEPLDFIAVWFALWRIGCIPIPLEASTAPAELARAAAESRAHRLFTSIPANLEVIEPVNKGATTTQPAWIHAQMNPHPAEATSSNTALFFYTSGTTGTPKCVIFDHTAMAANVISLAETINLSEIDVMLTPASPMLPATIATVVLPALCVGATLALPAQPIPGQVLRKIVSTGTTIFFGVPYLYELLAATMALRESSFWGDVRLCLSSSAFLDGHLFDKFYNLTHLPIRSVYCSSEAGACTFNNADDLMLIRDSVGRALRGVDLQIMHSSGRILSSGSMGQVVVRGSNVASGYFCRPELQEEVFDEGWVKTGDLGVTDDGGYLRLIGRLSQTINVSGYLVNPREVEQVLLSHPAVAEAFVYGVKDPIMGEIIAAKVVLVKGMTLSSNDELLSICANTLIHYKVPRYVTVVGKLPKSRYGKIARSASGWSDGRRE